jgi:hypothetical protein
MAEMPDVGTAYYWPFNEKAKPYLLNSKLLAASPAPTWKRC